MKPKRLFITQLMLCFCIFGQVLFAQTTEFTYQGSLKDAGNPASGNYDFEFALFDSLSGGSQVGPTIPKNMVAVANGIFTVKLDFGSAFPGGTRYLEIRVRLTGQPGFTALIPRQSVTASPYAITAGDVTNSNIARLNVPNTAVPATGTPTVNSGFITSATVTNGGSGYGVPPTVTVIDMTGAGAVIVANISMGGSVTSFTVQNPGSGYSAGATLSISSPPNNASQTFVSSNFFTGVNSMTNVNNTFAGNGSGLTNLNAAQLGGVAANQYVLTGDVRLSDARNPLPNSANYIQNSSTPQSSSNFNISGNGTIGGTLAAASLSGNGSGLTNVPGTLRWQVVSGTSQQAQPNTGYVAVNAAEVTITLPTAPNIGDTVRISGAGAGGWRIAQNTGQTVLAQNITGIAAGTTWIPRDSNRNWRAVVSSSDGSRLAAVPVLGNIYTSSDSGFMWTAQTSLNNVWDPQGAGEQILSSSADGSKLVAVAYSGQIFTSTNFGVNWTARENNRQWRAVASSSDGNKLIALVYGGQIYTSVDSGVTWTPREFNRLWHTVASSADGSKLVAAVNNSQIHTSTDSGASWTARDANRPWQCVASSADGNKLVAVVNGGLIYTSTDSGTTWIPRDTNRAWDAVASSSDGSRLVAVVNGGQVYISVNSGVTWTPRESNRSWNSVASSADGNNLVATVAGGQIYTSSSTSSLGTAGYLLGGTNAAIELQYIGNGQFIALSHEGTITAN